MGIGASMNLATTPSYIGEISSPSIRGRLASVLMVAYTIGISLSYAVGGFVCYRAAAVMMILSALMGVILFNFMPETPAHLYRIGEHKVRLIAYTYS